MLPIRKIPDVRIRVSTPANLDDKKSLELIRREITIAVPINTREYRAAELPRNAKSNRIGIVSDALTHNEMNLMRRLSFSIDPIASTFVVYGLVLNKF